MNPTGTARFYRPIVAEGAEAEAVFDLEPLEESDEDALLEPYRVRGGG